MRLLRYIFSIACVAMLTTSCVVSRAILYGDASVDDYRAFEQENIAKSDYTAKIPMAHGVDSLNVAAAGAVAFYQLSKRK